MQIPFTGKENHCQHVWRQISSTAPSLCVGVLTRVWVCTDPARSCVLAAHAYVQHVCVSGHTGNHTRTRQKENTKLSSLKCIKVLKPWKQGMVRETNTFTGVLQLGIKFCSNFKTGCQFHLHDFKVICPVNHESCIYIYTIRIMVFPSFLWFAYNLNILQMYILYIYFPFFSFKFKRQ